MKHLKQYCFFFSFFILAMLLLQHTSCVKEYSLEGMHNDTTVTDTTDTIIPPPPIIFPQCPLCTASDEITTGHWGFKTGNSYLCGSLTNSGFFAGNSKTAFTFFGPSSCSIDTGLVVSVYLPVPLDRDRYNLTTSETAFYYYDHNATNDILISRSPAIFSVTVNSFTYATGMVEGTFNGIVFTAAGDTAYVTNGRYKAILH